MKLVLEIKQKCSFFWLRGIRKVRIDKCCAKCFTADTFDEVFENTRFKEKALVSIDIQPNNFVKAYYLCGLSRGFKYEHNTHVVFVPHNNRTISISNDRINLTIENARMIDFEKYTPSPEGEFTEQQRTCRNWIFANYILDGMPL